MHFQKISTNVNGDSHKKKEEWCMNEVWAIYICGPFMYEFTAFGFRARDKNRIKIE